MGLFIPSYSVDVLVKGKSFNSQLNVETTSVLF